MTPSGIRVRGLRVAYGDVVALDGVDLDVGRGEVVGVVGPNGAGKSTLLTAVRGLRTPARGTVHVDGRPAHRARVAVAAVPQRVVTDPLVPVEVREIVWMGRYPHLGAVRRRRPADHRAVADALERVGITGLARRQVTALSGGQQRRAAVARALAQEAPYLVLDEPFAGIDQPTAADLAVLLRELAAGGTGVLLVNHDLDAVAATCDRVAVLNRTVVAVGPPADVLAPAVVARAYTP